MIKPLVFSSPARSSCLYDFLSYSSTGDRVIKRISYARTADPADPADSTGLVDLADLSFPFGAMWYASGLNESISECKEILTAYYSNAGTLHSKSCLAPCRPLNNLKVTFHVVFLLGDIVLLLEVELEFISMSLLFLDGLLLEKRRCLKLTLIILFGFFQIAAILLLLYILEYGSL